MKRIKEAAAVCLLGLGAYARFHDLAWQFTHIDDLGPAKTLLDAKFAGASPWFSVPFSWTYAPFQFLFTALFLQPAQTYREILFWGRLPSCAAGIAGLGVFAWLLRRLYQGDWNKIIFPLALMTLSLESVIYARQINNYSLGVLAFTLMTARVLFSPDKAPSTRIQAAASGVLIALLGSMQYQILFFAPAFFAVCFLRDLRKDSSPGRIAVLWAPGVLLFALLAFPLFHFFLQGRAGAGMTGWNAGPEGQYALSGASPFENLAASFVFFLKNTPDVFTSLTGFGAETNPAVRILSGVLVPLLTAAGISLAVFSKKKGQGSLALWTSLCFLTYAALVILGKLTFSPTRHVLILLPLAALGAGEGLNGLTAFLQKRISSVALLPWMISLAMSLIFILHLPAFYQERQDVFQEDEIAGVLRDYHVDVLLHIDHTLQPVMMKSITDYFGEREKGWEIHGVLSNGSGSDETLAWISHRDHLNPQMLAGMQKMVNIFASTTNAQRIREGQKPLPMLTHGPETYRVVYKKEIFSDTEIEYSRKTRNGTNQLFFYVLKR